MERKNTVLLTVIAIATLLVAVVGATFAYFTASNTINKDAQGATGTQTTKNLGGANFTSSKVTFGKEGPETLGALDYPGGSMIVGTTYTLSKKVLEDTNNYTAKFTLDVAGLNTTGQTVNWYLVKSENQPLATLTEGAVTCSLQSAKTSHAEDDGGADTMTYWYEGCTAADLFGSGKLMASLKLVAYGTINSTEDGDDAIIDNITDSTGQTSAATPFADPKEPEGLTQTLSTDGVSTATYYLVVEFPNNPNAKQEAQGKNIKAALVAPTTVETDLVGIGD